MVITMLAGGLGNQLFQYALGLRIATQVQTDLKLGTQLIESRLLARLRDYTPRRYELSSFVIDQPMASMTDLSQSLLKVVLPNKDAILLREQPGIGQYLNSITPPTRHVVCLGYWQSETYFKPIETTLRQQLIFRKQPSDYTRQLMAQIRAIPNPVFVHIRRGDYITNAKASEHHGFSGQTYYLDALAYLRSRIENPYFFVFSDDMPWVKTQLGDALQTATFVVGNTGDDSWQDMFLMSQCRHAIIANSSFSWWGAWLNPAPNRLVIAPRRWFATDTEANALIVPTRWYTL